MTVGELIRELESANQDAEVRIAQQPHWPFEYSIDEVADMTDYDPRGDFDVYRDEEGWYFSRGDDGEEGPFASDDEAQDAIDKLLADEKEELNIVYLSEGHQIGYLPIAASRKLGWR